MNDDLFSLFLPEGVGYKFREDELIEELKNYIDNTYSGHYGQGGLQSSEVIVDRGHGIGFFLGNVDKYVARYGKKGDPNDHRKDLMKVLHYALLALYEHDRLNSTSTDGMFDDLDYDLTDDLVITLGEDTIILNEETTYEVE